MTETKKPVMLKCHVCGGTKFQKTNQIITCRDCGASATKIGRKLRSKGKSVHKYPSYDIGDEVIYESRIYEVQSFEKKNCYGIYDNKGHATIVHARDLQRRRELPVGTFVKWTATYIGDPITQCGIVMSSHLECDGQVRIYQGDCDNMCTMSLDSVTVITEEEYYGLLEESQARSMGMESSVNFTTKALPENAWDYTLPKPCPCCGCRPTVDRVGEEYRVRCVICGLQSNVDASDRVIERWNKRSGCEHVVVYMNSGPIRNLYLCVKCYAVFGDEGKDFMQYDGPRMRWTPTGLQPDPSAFGCSEMDDPPYRFEGKYTHCPCCGKPLGPEYQEPEEGEPIYDDGEKVWPKDQEPEEHRCFYTGRSCEYAPVDGWPCKRPDVKENHMCPKVAEDWDRLEKKGVCAVSEVIGDSVSIVATWLRESNAPVDVLEAWEWVYCVSWPHKKDQEKVISQEELRTLRAQLETERATADIYKLFIDKLVARTGSSANGVDKDGNPVHLDISVGGYDQEPEDGKRNDNMIAKLKKILLNEDNIFTMDAGDEYVSVYRILTDVFDVTSLDALKMSEKAQEPEG